MATLTQNTPVKSECKHSVRDIPRKWEIKNMVNNSTIKARIGWQGLTTQEYQKNGKFFLVTGTDFKDEKINWDNCVFVDEKRYSQDKNIQLKQGDVLVTKDGTIGKIAYIDNLLLPATLNTGIFVIRPINKDYLSLFLFYILCSDYFDKFLNKLKAGSTINHLYQKDFVNFDFIAPPYPEQEKITKILSDTVNLLEQLDYLITKKKNIKQGAMQDLLTEKKRLSGFNKKWDSDIIQKCAKITTGSKNTQDKINEGKFPFFVRSQKVERINTYSYDGEAVLTAGDGVGTGKVFHYINGKFDFHQRVYKISDFDERLEGYFFYLYFSNYFFGRIMSMTAKSSVDSVRKDMIENMIIPLPEKKEQIAIAKILFDMDLEIKELEIKKEKYIMIKNGMMQKLLTGEIRLV